MSIDSASRTVKTGARQEPSNLGGCTSWHGGSMIGHYPNSPSRTGACHAQEESQEDRAQTRRLQEEAEEASRARRGLNLAPPSGKVWCRSGDSNPDTLAALDPETAWHLSAPWRSIALGRISLLQLRGYR